MSYWFLSCLATWAEETSAPAASWESIASDASGQYLVAGCYNNSNHIDIGSIWTSNNYGFTWNQTSAPDCEWNSIASDASGQYLTSSGGGAFTLQITMGLHGQEHLFLGCLI